MNNYFRVAYYLFRMMNRPFMPADELARFREKKLRQMIGYAYDYIPFYHKRFKEAGVKPGNIRDRDELCKLPVLRKEDIRNNLDEMISKQYDVLKLEKHWTSGSTGQPLVFYISQKENDFRKAKHLRGNMSLGQRPRDRWVTITPPFRFTNVSKLQRGLGLFAPIPVSVFSGPSKQISVIESVRPDLIDGYSSSLLLLAREVERRGLDTIKPRMLFGGAELSDEISREYIERVFDAPFYDRYATVELERVAWQCPHKKYHIDADTLLLEFVDENGETVAPGEKGEVVCTSLFNYAMPFIRYALGDVGVRSDEECTCGRTFPLMKVVEGRKDSLVILPDGRTLSPRTFTLAMRMFSSYKDISQFRVVQEKHDLLEFHIKKKNDDIPDETIKEGLLYHIRRTLNIDPDQVKLEVRFVTSIPLNKGGKLMAVVSKVKRERLLR